MHLQNPTLTEDTPPHTTIYHHTMSTETSPTHSTHLAVPAGLTFIAPSIFALLEQIARAHEPDQDSINLLWKMLQELEKFEIIGHCRLKAYVERHRDAVRRVHRVQGGKGCELGNARTMGQRFLFDGTRFRDLAKAYFEVVESLEGEKGEVEKLNELNDKTDSSSS